MCGIAGIAYAEGPRAWAMQTVRDMIARQRHRGPDGEGFYDTTGASLGHCRLAIIDLHETGRQPMSDGTGKLWITFNGEIYNYVELRDELQAVGYRFRGQSDTEVLLAAYKTWGPACLSRLRGMFAFAIWDERTTTLFAARDRFGIKPFHYWTDGRQLAFASEIKALLSFVPHRHIDLALAKDYLAWNLLDHEPSRTMVNDIRRLPPAHALSWSPAHGLSVWPYWSLNVSRALEATPEQEASMIDQFRQRFQQTISIHLRSDVPVGTSLSGGLDSSAIVCVVSAELRRRGAWRHSWQHTFSACFHEPHLDERPYINAVVSETGCTPHHVFPSGEGLADEMDRWLWHQDEPVGGTGVYAQYCVARLAREHGIKVLLDGQGADELLAGYRKFILVYLRELIRSGQVTKTISETMAFLLSPQILKTSGFVEGRRYLLRCPPELTVLWGDEHLPQRPHALGIGDSLGRRIQADVTQYSLPVLLRYEDRNMMAFGIESRVPFVDHVLVDLLAALPSSLRLSHGWTKRIMREALRGILPDMVRERKSKLGFLTPASAWLRGPLMAWVCDTLAAPRYLADVVDLRGVRQFLAQWRNGHSRPHVEDMLFRLAMYEAWARRVMSA
jgi:asparagine synthase (glutamine-hydrolysing)